MKQSGGVLANREWKVVKDCVRKYYITSKSAARKKLLDHSSSKRNEFS